MGDGKIYISAKRGIPDMSMGYWLPDRPLLKRIGERCSRSFSCTGYLVACR